VLWFLIVGTAAAAVHWLVVFFAVRAGMTPLAANPLGWFVAFWLSWSGHRLLTFRSSDAAMRQSLPRFALISLAGFGINQVAYATLLHGAGLRYDLALALVLVAVAVLTWFASGRWAFNGRHSSAPAAPGPDATNPPPSSD